MYQATQAEIDKRLDLKIYQAFIHCQLSDEQPTTCQPNMPIAHADPIVVRQQLLAAQSAWQPLHLSARLNAVLGATLDTKPAPFIHEKDKQAFVNLVDYYFERSYLPRMPPPQIIQYMSALQDNIRLDVTRTNAPIVLEGMHHRLAFSANYCIGKMLIAQHGITNLIMLHQHAAPDPRLVMLKKIAEAQFGITLHLVRLQPQWFRQLINLTDANTLIYVMGDLPLPANTPQPKKRALQLSYAEQALTLNTFSLAAKIAHRIKAQHLVCDYSAEQQVLVHEVIAPEAPSHKVIVHKQFAALPAMQCPLEDWVFWPAVPSLFMGQNRC